MFAKGQLCIAETLTERFELLGDIDCTQDPKRRCWQDVHDSPFKGLLPTYNTCINTFIAVESAIQISDLFHNCAYFSHRLTFLPLK